MVWLYERYLVYDNGDRVKNGSSYVVIGNSNHTSFLRTNSNRGSVDIPARLSGGDVDMENVRVFASIEDAMQYLQDEEDDEPRPGSPEREPEDDDSGSQPTLPSLPTQPGYGLGGGGGRLFSNGGM